MRRWRQATAVIGIFTLATIYGCDLGWDFLNEAGKGSTGSSSESGATASAQASCQSSRLAVGQLPVSGALFSTGTFRADYSSPSFNGSISTRGLGLRVSRNRLWLNDLTIEVSFFPFDDTEHDIRNGCLGRAILEINIPPEKLFFDNSTIDITSTRISQTSTSAFYAEGGDPGFTATAVNGTIRLQSTDGSSVQVFFDLTFNPGTSQRRLTNGEIDDDIDQNPAAEGLQP